MILRVDYCCSVAAHLCPAQALAAARNSRTGPALLLLYTRPNLARHERQQRRASWSTPARREVTAPPSAARTPQTLRYRFPLSTRRVARCFTSSRHVSSKVGLPAAAAINAVRARGQDMEGGGSRFGPEEGEEGGLTKRQQGERRDLKGLKQRVVVGMSGGVDSSVVAMLLHQQGYEVVGVFMRNWDEQDETGSDVCAADTDLEDARRVGYHLGIPVKTVDFSREYWNQVFEPSLQEFDRCRTPNMDVACNRFIKFDAFREYALGRMSADFVATGHYARTAPGPGRDWSRPVLRQAEDGNKDQTYFLSRVPSEGLAKVLFPLGGLTKPEVRRLAEEGGLPVARKRESMGVCFVGKRRSWASFISQYLTPSPGNFVCVDTGEVVGRHGGVQLYTVGQKSHLDGMPEKYYVAGLDSDSNSVYVARGADNPSLFARGLSVLASEFSWVAGCPPPELLSGSGSHPSAHARREATEAGGGPAGVEAPVPTKERQPAAPGGEPIDAGEMEGPPPVLRCEYRSRHRQALLPCGVELLGGGGSGASVPRPVVHVRFDEPAKAIAPGQVVALYKEGICLGGGPILRAEGNCSPALVRSTRPPSSRPAAKKQLSCKNVDKILPRC